MPIAILILNSLLVAAVLVYVWKSAYERGYKAGKEESRNLIEQLAEANRSLNEQMELERDDQTSVCPEFPDQYYKRILH